MHDYILQMGHGRVWEGRRRFKGGQASTSRKRDRAAAGEKSVQGIEEIIQMIEIIGFISGVFAVIGVLANNRKLRWCFLVWMVSNAMSMAIHIDAGIWSLVGRDAAFLTLAVEGWFLWGKRNLTGTCHREHRGHRG